MIGLPEIYKEIRGILSPVLKKNGFTKVITRNNWGRHNECIWVLDISAIGNYFSDITGWTPMSLTVTLGIYYEFIPTLDDGIKVGTKGELLPKYHQCHLWKELNCKLDQSKYKKHLENPAERERNDIWWVETDGSNIEEVLTDINKSFLDDGLPWIKKFTNLDVAFEEIEKEVDSYNKFYKAKFFAKHLNKMNQYEEYFHLFEKELIRLGER